MIVETTAGIIAWTLSILIGRSVLVGVLRNRNQLFPNYLQSLLGISFIFSITYLMTLFDIDNKNVKYLLIPLLGIAFFMQKEFIKTIFEKNKINLIKIINIVLLLGAFSWLNNSSFFDSKMSIRYGPDQFGWIISSEKLCNQNLDSIGKYALQQTGATNINDLFGEGINKQKIIYAVPNFNLQIANEFLIGAKRIGIPSLTASICSSMGVNNTLGILNTILTVFIINIILMFYRFTRNFNIYISSILCWYFLFNLGFISVHLEGGYGQTVGTVYLLSLVLALKEFSFKSSEFLLANILTLTYSLTTYSDLIPIYAIVITPIFLYYLYEHKISFTLKKIMISLLIISVVTLAFREEILKVVTNRLSNRNFGGWDQGRNPSVADMAGLNNWLPDDGTSEVYDNYISQTILTIFIISILVIFFIRISKTHLFILGYTYLIYAVIYIDTYYISNDPINSYRLWKLSGYFIIAHIVIIVGLINSLKIKDNSGIRISTYCILLFVLPLNLHSSVQWIEAWQRNKSLSFNSETKDKIQDTGLISNHDIRVVGMGQPGLRFLLVGDIHYYSFSRGFGVPVIRQFPNKPIVFIVDKSVCGEGTRCTLELESKFYVDKLFEFEEFDIFLEKLKT
jgi:hypothetical protein